MSKLSEIKRIRDKRLKEKNWRIENREKLKISKKKSYEKNKEKRSARAKLHHQEKKDFIFSILGDKCKNCGFNDKRALQIDHVNGRGADDREYAKILGTSFIKYLLGEIRIEEKKVNYQILCANCNWIKRVENGEVRKRGKLSDFPQHLIDEKRKQKSRP